MLKKCLAVAAVAPLMLGVTSCGGNDDTNAVKNVNAVEFVPEFITHLAPVTTGANQQEGITQEAWNEYWAERNLFVNNGLIFERVERQTTNDGDEDDDEYDVHYVLKSTNIDPLINKLENLMDTGNLTKINFFASQGITITQAESDLLRIEEDELTPEQKSDILELMERLIREEGSALRRMADFSRNLDLPTTVNNAPLISISEDAFRNLGELVRTVNFDRMNYLTTIGAGAFEGTEINSVSIDGLEYLVSIGEDAFRGGLVVLDGIKETFSNGLITDVTLSNLENLRTIDANAFADNEITNVTLSNLESLVTTIGARAFANNEITNVELAHMNASAIENADIFAENNIRNLTLDNIFLGGTAADTFVNRFLTRAGATVTTLNTGQWLTIAQFNALDNMQPAINFVARDL